MHVTLTAHFYYDTSLITPTLMSAVMEHFFSPTRKFQDLWEESSHYSMDDPFEHAEYS
jgi:hypothetical protein